MLELREKDWATGRTYLDRLNTCMFLFFAPWLAAFSFLYVYYNNKVTGITPERVPMVYGWAIAVVLLGVCIYVYLSFTKKLKELPGKDLKVKFRLYFEFLKTFYWQMNLIAIICTLLYALLNSIPLAIFNCFIVVIMSLEKPGEERLFRHLRLKSDNMKGFKDRSLLDN